MKITDNIAEEILNLNGDYSLGISVTLPWLRCLQITLDGLECTLIANSAL